MTTRRSLRIYVAGPIQGVDLLHALRNIDEGQAWTAKIFQLGFSPFPVFTDASFIQKIRPVPSIQDIYAYSLQWLKVSDAMFMCPGFEKSTGCKMEMRVAEDNGIPIFFDLHELSVWGDSKIIPVDNGLDEILARSDD